MKKVEKEKKRKHHLTLRAVVIRKNGKIEDLGVIAKGSSIKMIPKIGGGSNAGGTD